MRIATPLPLLSVDDAAAVVDVTVKVAWCAQLAHVVVVVVVVAGRERLACDCSL